MKLHKAYRALLWGLAKLLVPFLWGFTMRPHEASRSFTKGIHEASRSFPMGLYKASRDVTMGFCEASSSSTMGLHEASRGFAMSFATENHEASRVFTMGALVWGFMEPLGACLWPSLWELYNGASLQSFATGLCYMGGGKGVNFKRNIFG